MTDNRTERLVTLISVSQDGLFRYVFSLLPHDADARDVLQETLMEITKQFDDYDSSRPFLPWACRFAYYKVLKHREQNPRRMRFFDTDVLKLLVCERDVQAHVMESRLAALDKCMEKLPLPDRELLAARYLAKIPLQDMVAQFRWSRRTLLRNLQRLRRLLFKCIGTHAVLGDLE